MNDYYLIIKSGGDMADYERGIEADSLHEALDKFMDILGPYGWDRATILKNMACEKCMNKFDSRRCNHE